MLRASFTKIAAVVSLAVAGLVPLAGHASANTIWDAPGASAAAAANTIWD
ncbi:hypothetical protein AB0940_33360 [Streptomyces sp. NPDC006656]